MYEHCLNEVKQSILYTSPANDLAESSLDRVTANVQCYGCIDIYIVAAVSDVAVHVFLSRGIMNK